jgi:hypothetical protein
MRSEGPQPHAHAANLDVATVTIRYARHAQRGDAEKTQRSSTSTPPRVTPRRGCLPRHGPATHQRLHNNGVYLPVTSGAPRTAKPPGWTGALCSVGDWDATGVRTELRR